MPVNDTLQATGSSFFSLKLIYPQPNTLTVKWELNGSILPGTDTFRNISNSQLQMGINKLTAYVTDTTLLSRSYWPGKGYQFSKSWTIEKNAANVKVHQQLTGRFFYKLYPNPAQEQITLSYENRDGSKQLRYDIMSIDGRLVASGGFEATGDGEQVINLSDLPSGAYLLKLTGKEISVEERFIRK